MQTDFESAAQRSCNEQFDSCQKVYPADNQNGSSLTGLDTDSEYRPVGVLLAARLSEPAEKLHVSINGAGHGG
ncbi:uncharacterized protein Aud_003390 [Aspergillus udagawae]|uniref:Uncharacterized protein n=1 Tax=Aspergillus udagawae TaxID=91492 RepID=A0A8E0QLE3_9EURO|nr:uncharacterized protein Aud_003390 [Aspergillus udagawae]GIC87009.1 hypothetical protein Aud_003390 [Aspergillus udagawae]